MHPAYHKIKNALSGKYSPSESSSLARWVLTDVFKIPAIDLYSNKDDDFLAKNGEKLAIIINRLQLYEPLQYILRKSIFFGMTLEVSPDVLIPRPETSELVEWILSENEGRQGMRILDIGTGSGCIAITLAKNLKGSAVTATDISQAALKTAKRNAIANGAEVRFLQTDILSDPLTGTGADIIVSNPPYVTMSERAEMSRNVVDWEPEQALYVPDDDPLKFYRRIAEVGLSVLCKGGQLYFEINRRAGKAIERMLRELGYTSIELRKDLSGNDRMIRAIRQ